jgi:hypothetical protein
LFSWAYAFQKRPTKSAKETYILAKEAFKRGLHPRKRPSKEAYILERDLHPSKRGLAERR